jgi:hypothetical protein
MENPAMKAWIAALLCVYAAAAVGQSRVSLSQIPLPAGVIEHTNLGIDSVVELKDGSVLANNGRVSSDGGKSWSQPRPFGAGIRGSGLLRLNSGGIALTEGTAGGSSGIWISRNEGKTWEATPDSFQKAMGGPNFLGDEMIQLSKGRLVRPFSIDFNPKFREFLYENVQSVGLWRGMPVKTEGHQHLPEIYMTFVAYSDDEASTWKTVEGYYKTPQALWGWFNEEGIPTGHGGHTSFGECTMAETKDGGILMFGRSEVGRVVQTNSTDSGETWTVVLPTELVNSGSPPRLRRIPKTGDLLCVWNQMSRDEIRRGYRRGRLSSAISKDGGLTWRNFRTLELSEGLDNVVRVPAQYPIRMVRANDFVGRLPDGWSYFHYANVSFVGDSVYVMYLRGGPLLGIAEQNLDKQENVLRIYPLAWFYGGAETQ